MSLSSCAFFDPNWLHDRIDRGLSALSSSRPRRGPKAGVGLPELLVSLVRQKLFRRGALDEHLFKFNAQSLQGSTISRRLRKVDSGRLDRISDQLLEPVGNPEANPDGYLGSYRLVGIDGTRFTLQNTPAILKEVPKAKTAQSPLGGTQEVAFPQIYACSLVELGPHNPLAVSVGSGGQGELTVAGKLLDRLGPADMLLGDCLYGVGWFLHQLTQSSRCGAFLLKVFSEQTSSMVKPLEDGSCMVEVRVRSRTRPADIIATHRVREIKYQVDSVNAEGKAETKTYRLWTNLMDCREYPACELAALYNTRWEHEGYYKELKLEMKKHKYLNSQLLETAQLEILSMVWASALIARERQRIHEKNSEANPCKTGKAPEPLRTIRFDLVRENLATLWTLYESLGDIITEEQYQSFIRKFTNDASLFLSPKRRSRSCPRKVRQSVSHWPKLRTRTQSKIPARITILERD
jgi:hypothetical protein